MTDKERNLLFALASIAAASISSIRALSLASAIAAAKLTESSNARSISTQGAAVSALGGARASPEQRREHDAPRADGDAGRVADVKRRMAVAGATIKRYALTDRGPERVLEIRATSSPRSLDAALRGLEEDYPGATRYLDARPDGDQGGLAFTARISEPK